MTKSILAALVIALPAAMGTAQETPSLEALPTLVFNHPEAAAMISLGQMLFFDPRLSGDSSTSCAECHDPRSGFGDGAELSRG